MVKDNRGFTFVELLAVLALMSIIIMLVSSAHLFGQKQFKSQSNEISQQADIRYITNLVAKDVRQARSIAVSESELHLGDITYQLTEGRLKKNGIIIAESVLAFEPEILPADKGNGIEVLVSISGKRTISLKTIIYVRE